MHDTERIQSVASERAILVRVILPDQLFEADPLEELEGLAETAGTTVAGAPSMLATNSSRPPSGL